MKTKLLFSSLIILISVSSLTGCKDNNLFNDSSNDTSNDITIYGNVIDRTTGLPLYNVLIQEKNKVGGSTVTGNDGNYEFTLPLNGSSSGKYYIVASKDKYSTSEYELNMSQVDKNRRVKVDFQLTSESIFYTGVVVDSKNQPIVDAKISAKFYYWGEYYNIGTTAITTIDGSYTLELPRPHEYNESSRKALDQWQFTITASKDGYVNTQHVLNQSADDMGIIITLNFIMKSTQEQDEEKKKAEEEKKKAENVTIFGTVTDTKGETEPKTEYTWDNYKWCKEYDSKEAIVYLTKYCPDSKWGYEGFTDDKKTLEPEDDAAHVHWGGGWRTPTQAEWAELMNEANCTWKETEQNGVQGDLVTSKKTGNSIFLPKNRGEYGQGAYWSSSLYDDTSSKFNGPFGWEFRFYPVTYYELTYGARFSGYGIRPVCPAK